MVNNKQQRFGLDAYLPEHGRIIINAPDFDFDSFPALAERLLRLLSATALEKQYDADIHSWLIDFEGCHMLLKAEHYSESVWLEALSIKGSQDEFNFLAKLFADGF